MPTYQYSCTDCGHFFEAVQSFSDDSLTVCPECGGALRKVFNAVGVVFKGSGFYRTDSRGSGGSGSGSGEGSSAGSAKPAAKDAGSTGAPASSSSSPSTGSSSGGSASSGSASTASA